jgi:hypothetical protein
MFCHKCGNKVNEGADFCHKCGAKMVADQSTQQAAEAQQSTVGAVLTATPQLADIKTSDNSIELVVIGAKVEGQVYEKYIFHVLIDGIKVGQLSNGGTLTHKITPGQHCVKIGRTRIWIDVPRGNAPVMLNWHWGENIKPEIVCSQSHFVTKSSETTSFLKSLNAVGMAAITCVALGIVGVIVGFLLFPAYRGSVVTAQQHLAISAAMDFALPFLIGGFALVVIGAVIMILPIRKEK